MNEDKEDNYEGVKISIPDKNFEMSLEKNMSNNEIFKISVNADSISYVQKVNFSKDPCLMILNIKRLNPMASSTNSN
jgi:hypothetical protein